MRKPGRERAGQRVFDSIAGNCQLAGASQLTQTMKNGLQNLLIALALALCGLCAWQWHREAKLRQEIQRLTDSVQDHRERIQGLEGTLKRSEEEVKRLESLRVELVENLKSNRAHIAQLTKDLARTEEELEKSARKIEDYKRALDTANQSIIKQNEDIKRQNEEVKKLVEERNDAVVKYNKLVAEFNDLAKKWNALQEQLATNAPPAKKSS